MTTISERIVTFLETSGLLRGRIPPARFRAADICAVNDPVDAVTLGVRAQFSDEFVLAGVSVGLHPRTCSVTVPDLLLGSVLDGRWTWPTDEPGGVVNLHARRVPLRVEGYPVFLTFAACANDKLRRTRPVVDVYEAVRRRTCARFWARAKEEFVARAWHPARLRWCLDVDEAREIFSADS